MYKEHIYYVYILASGQNGTLYTGVTNSLLRRTFQHKLKEDSKSFTAKYKIDKLVFYESYQFIQGCYTKREAAKKME